VLPEHGRAVGIADDLVVDRAAVRRVIVSMAISFSRADGGHLTAVQFYGAARCGDHD